MKPVTLVRMAAIFALIHAVLHTAGGVFGKIEAGPATVAVTAMKGNQFLTFGTLRTFWDFYMGLGLAVTIFLTTEALALWFLAPLTFSYGQRLRPPLMVFAIGYLMCAVNSFRYFFIGPVVVEVLIAVCLFAAVAGMRSDVADLERGRRLTEL